MKLTTLDLHGKRHHEVDLIVENFIFLNQDDCPLLIICGNSQKMISLVIQVLDRVCLLYTSPSPRDATLSRMPSSA